MSTKRFIEDSFPVKEVSAESAREKNIRHGHISTLHIWWARRPLASSRATIYASLIPAAKTIEEWNEKRNFIIEFSKWENSLRPDLIEKARKDILEANGGVPPKVLDPFAGGGAIPLEALRLGCETYASDLNPVAVLINKCTLEYPQKYGRPEKRKVKVIQFGQEIQEEVTVNPLIEDVKKWGQWVLEEARKEIGKFYPEEPDGSIPVGYIWARTIPCQNPTCGTEIPLMRQYWLANKEKKKVALYPFIEEKKVKFKIVGTGYDKIPPGFNPGDGTISRAVVVCPVCNSVVADNDTRRLFHEGKASERMIAVITHFPKQVGKKYRIANEEDIVAIHEASVYLSQKREQLKNEWGIDPVPDEPVDENSEKQRTFSLYGMLNWGELYNARQALSLVSLLEKVRTINLDPVDRQDAREYQTAVKTYLALAMDKLASFSTKVCRWKSGSEQNIPIFSGRNAFPMVFDYFEVNSIGHVSTSWENCLETVLEPLEGLTTLDNWASVQQASATELPMLDNYFDAVFTDPPYYDNINYAELSDFFYMWLKRIVGDEYSSLFSTPMVSKAKEIVANPSRQGNWENAKLFFETSLKEAFREIYRVLKPNGISVIVYAHKSTEGWETLINSLLDSGLVVSGAWPLNTEMDVRLNAEEAAALASSIYIVSHKLERAKVGFYNEVREELKTNLSAKLTQLWSEGLSGADFFIAAIGSAIEVFGKYEKVMDFEGNVIRANKMLQDVRELATDYAVRQILHNGFAGEISDLTRFYVLFRWEYGEAKVQFDEAKKLAMSISFFLRSLWGWKTCSPFKIN